MTSPPEVVSLTEAADLPLWLVGGKAWGLGRLVRAGFDVPPGFCLTTAALPTVWRVTRDTAVSLLAPHVVRQVQDNWLALRAPHGVAVRSSSVAEDGAKASAAGQYLTVLHVRNLDDLLAAVLACWQSQQDAAAIDYQRRSGLPTGSCAMAVVVQAMVRPAWAGVMFTSDKPEGGEARPLLLEAVPGVADVLVDGSVEATRVLLAAEPPHHVLLQLHPPEHPPLPIALLAALGKCGVAVQSALGAPQDVEWASDDSGLVLLQARPITAPVPLPQPPASGAEQPPGARWARMSICDSWLTEPLSPLFATTLFPRLVDRWATNWGGPTGRRVANPLIPHPMHGVVGGFAYLRFDFPLSRHPLRTLLLMARWLVFHLSPVERRWRDGCEPELRRAVARARCLDVPAATTSELVSAIDDVEEATARYWAVIGGLAWHWNASEWLLTRLLSRPSQQGAPAVGDLLSSGDRMSRRAEAHLDRIAARRPDDRHELWSDYLSLYGHLVHSLDFAEATPAEDPAVLSAAIASRGAGHKTPPFVPVPSTEQTGASTAVCPAPRAWLRRGRLFDRVLTWARHWSEVRDAALFSFTLGWPVLRTAYLELGRRLADEGAVDEAGDIFYLTGDELQQWLDAVPERPKDGHHAAVAQRRWQRHARQGHRPPDVVPTTARIHLFGLDITGLALFGSSRRNLPEGDQLVGSPVSSGQYTGRARLLLRAEEAGALQPGEVLVVRQVSPAWAPLLAGAGAVVADVGGALSHGSVVAREYQIPAVMGVGEATTRIRPGQMLHVDGDRGTVRLLDDE